MIQVEDAIQIIHTQRLKLHTEEVDILHAINRVLAESIVADRDFPPFNRVAMDGIAILSNSFLKKGQEFLIEDVQAAGSPQKKLKALDTCIEVMTGSILPENANAVVRYEDVEIKNGKAAILLDAVKPFLNVHQQGSDAKTGDVLLTVGQKISAAEVALLASVGKASVKVWKLPKAAVLSTGDELVEIGENPLPHQIRRSNTYAIQSAMSTLGWQSSSFHLPDNKNSIKSDLQKILQTHDVLILSGGVSKGKFDFIPETLLELGIKKLFHQVNQRPGKPFWFGASKDQSKIVFALPGNPVSTFLCFYKYIVPWVLANEGANVPSSSAILASDFSFNPSLAYFLQVRVKSEGGKFMAYPVPGGGSGDFANLKAVDGFLELPFDKSEFKAGEAYPFISFRV